MKLKILLIDKKTQQEIDDLVTLQLLQGIIETLIVETLPEYDFKTTIYGEIVPFRR